MGLEGQVPWNGSTARSKLLGLLCLMLIFGTSRQCLQAATAFARPAASRIARSFQTYDQVVDAFDRIVPGTTNAQDLPNLGFDPMTGNVDVLSYVDIEARFMRARSALGTSGRSRCKPASAPSSIAPAMCFIPARHPANRLGRFATCWALSVSPA